MTARLGSIVFVLALASFLGAQEVSETEKYLKQFSWGREADGLRLGIAVAFPGPASPANLEVKGVLHNRSDKTQELNADTFKSNILCLKVYKTEDGNDPVPTIPPSVPPVDPRRNIVEVRAGGFFEARFDLQMFSPELKPGTYWLELRYGKGVSPRVKVEISAPAPAPDEAAARKAASDWVKARGKEKWGAITRVEDRTDHWLVTFTLVLSRGTPVEHPAGLFIHKSDGRIQEAPGE